MSVESVRRQLRRDDKLRRFKKAFDSNPDLVIDYQALHDELTRLHKTRSVRSLRRKSRGFTDDIVDAMIQDTSIRARCTEILGSCVRINGHINDTLNNLRDYLLVEYNDSLRIVGTVKERQSIVESVLRPFYETLDKLEQLRSHARLIVEDIDKASYIYRNLVESLKMLSKPETVL